MSLNTYQHGTGASRVQLKTIFNRVTEYKPFVVDHVELIEHKSQPMIEISMRARENGLATCSACGERCSGYETQRTSRRFDFIPLWMLPGRVGLCDASRELPDVWRQSRASSVG